jgi:eukaryotic-like serine/threonine-protein kinase
MPASGVSWQDFLAYVGWLDRTGRVPNARPCTDHEWERAARGSDGRSFPHGKSSMAPNDANFDETYGRKDLAYGPDEVGSFPATESPFGVVDLAGNVSEMVAGANGAIILKGGSWYHGPITANASNRSFNSPSGRDGRAGMRVCADAATAR